MKLGKLFESFCQRTGVDITKDYTPEFKALLSSDVEVPEEIATKLDKGLLTLDAAKSNQDLTKHFRHSILGPADAEMDALIAELGLQPGDDFVADKNTYTKLRKLVTLANETGKKAANAPNKQTADEYVKKEADLRKTIKDLTDSITAKENEFKTTRDADLTNFALEKILLNKELALPKEMDGDLKLQTALAAINKKLTTKNLIVKRDPSTGALSVVNKADGTPAYGDNSVPLEANSLIDAALAENKLLVVNDPNKAKTPGSTGNPAKDIEGKTGGGNAAIQAEFDQQLAEMDKQH